MAVIQLVGDVDRALTALTGDVAPQAGQVRLADLGGIDRGLVSRVGDRSALLMPHGGVRLVQRLVERLASLGVAIVDAGSADPREAFPEASSDEEAAMLSLLARAASPAAIDALLADPGRAAALARGDDAPASRALRHLVEPPTVVLVGPPNVGKSTLTNRLAGRDLAVALDEPGTTRDYLVALVDLGGLVVRWHDTAGLRETTDPIERRAVERTRAVLEDADLVIAITDAAHDWPDLPRPPDLRIASRADLGSRPDADVAVCAPTGQGIAQLVELVRSRLAGGASDRN